MGRRRWTAHHPAPTPKIGPRDCGEGCRLGVGGCGPSRNPLPPRLWRGVPAGCGGRARHRGTPPAARPELAAIGPADRRGLHALALGAIAAVEADDDLLAQRLVAELGRRPRSSSDDAGTLARWAQLTVTWRTGGAVEVARPSACSPRPARREVFDQLVAVATSAAAREGADVVSRAGCSPPRRPPPPPPAEAPTDVVAHLVRADAALKGMADAPSDDDLAEAARALGDAGVTGLAAAARAARGRLAATQGHRDQAIAHLAAAAEDHLRSGRHRAASSLVGDLDGFGHVGRRAAAALGAAPLTAREREIACLAADGHTAQAIAQRLVISLRTVETHLAHVYAKLAVSGRREMERRAEELGSAGPDEGAPPGRRHRCPTTGRGPRPSRAMWRCRARSAETRESARRLEAVDPNHAAYPPQLIPATSPATSATLREVPATYPDAFTRGTATPSTE